MFKRTRVKNAAAAIYNVIVHQARLPAFYTDFGVPDTVDGRFDMIVLHMVLCLRRMRAPDARLVDHAQALFDLMFGDMDHALREMGVGDLAVGKKIKTMTAAFYGRASAYDKALDEDDREMLAHALNRNLFPGHEAPATFAYKLADYARQAACALASREISDILTGRFDFYNPNNLGDSPGEEPKT